MAEQQRQKKKTEDGIQKKMQQQESRIKAMEMELAKMKKQRDEAEAQRKFGEERFSKFKGQAVKDLSTAKKNVKEKDQANFKLKNDLKKQAADISMVEELKESVVTQLRKEKRDEIKQRRWLNEEMARIRKEEAEERAYYDAIGQPMPDLPKQKPRPYGSVPIKPKHQK